MNLKFAIKIVIQELMAVKVAKKFLKKDKDFFLIKIIKRDVFFGFYYRQVELDYYEIEKNTFKKL